MSDEDRDVDIESDDDDDISVSGGLNRSYGGQVSVGGAEKRAHHNALERKRRDHIKESFHSLRDAIPSLQGEKVNPKKSSRAQILKQATDYIQFMSKKNNTHQHDIDDLRQQNNLLETQVKALEKAKTTGQFATQAGSKMDNSKSGASSGNSYEGDSGSDTSDSETTNKSRRKKLKT